MDSDNSTAAAAPVVIMNSHPLDTSDDHRSALNVVAWILAIMTATIIFARFVTRYNVTGKFGVDDILIVVSLILAFGQTGALSSAVSHGFGLIDSTGTDVVAQEKAIYVFNILFIVSQCFAKSSVAIFVRTITPVRSHINMCIALLGATIVWTVSSIFVLAFQCQTPETWNISSGRCIDTVAAFTYIEVVNILIDICLILIPSIVVWGVQKQSKLKKLLTILTLSTRFVVIFAVIAQLAVVYNTRARADSVPLFSWDFALVTQIVEYTSIASACAPFLKPFLESVNSGMLRSDASRHLNSTISGSQKNTSRIGVSLRYLKRGDTSMRQTVGSGADNEKHRLTSAAATSDRNISVSTPVENESSSSKGIMQTTVVRIDRV